MCVCFLELDRDKPNNAILLLPIAARFSFLTVDSSLADTAHRKLIPI